MTKKKNCNVITSLVAKQRKYYESFRIQYSNMIEWTNLLYCKNPEVANLALANILSPPPAEKNPGYGTDTS